MAEKSAKQGKHLARMVCDWHRKVKKMGFKMNRNKNIISIIISALMLLICTQAQAQLGDIFKKLGDKVNAIQQNAQNSSNLRANDAKDANDIKINNKNIDGTDMHLSYFNSEPQIIEYIKYITADAQKTLARLNSTDESWIITKPFSESELDENNLNNTLETVKKEKDEFNKFISALGVLANNCSNYLTFNRSSCLLLTEYMSIKSDIGIELW
jgi:predicted PurR-regulated permease PerM